MYKWLKNTQLKCEATLLPPVCVLCGGAGEIGTGKTRDLCSACHATLPWAGSQCARCALPLSATNLEALCGNCQKQPPAFERCLSPFIYQAPLDQLLLGLKFNGQLAQARLLGELMADWVVSVLDNPPDHIIPVPLHSARLRERGFNQSVELARPIAKRLGLALSTRDVWRIRATTPQSDLTRKQRLKNIKGAFAVRQPLNGNVVIVDDVMTTGSTAHELARTVLNAGAERVEVWVCARA